MYSMNQKIKAKFSKTGDMRFISHLDLVRLFQRASRRAALPVTITKGYNPHLKISITRALRLGVESSGEEIVFNMDKEMKGDVFLRTINEKLPTGIEVLKIEG